MRTRFWVAVEPDLAERLDTLVAEKLTESADWWDHQLAEVKAITDRTERRAALGELRAERERRREDGTYFDTTSSVVVHHLLAELDARGWRTRHWRPIPHSDADLPGRRWGVVPGSRGLLSGRINVQVPHELAELLRRATWWTSEPATRRLQQLADFRTLTDTQLAERDRLRARVITTGDVLRAAANRALGA